MARKAMVLDTTTGRIRQSTVDFVELGDPVTNVGGYSLPSGVVPSGSLIRHDGVQWRYIFVPGILTDGSLFIDTLRGVPIENVSPSNGQALVYNSSIAKWVPQEITVSGGSGSTITVRESDGSPSISNVVTVAFANSTVTDLGSGTVLVTPSGTGSSSGESTGGILYLWENFT